MNDCIYCQIIKGESPCYKLYEDDLFICILDIFPRSKGHALVIPKKHYRWVYDVAEFKEYWDVALKLTKAMQKALTPEFVTYVTHGTQVFHAHILVMPRYKGETEYVPEIKKLSKEEMEEIAEKIRKAF